MNLGVIGVKLLDFHYIDKEIISDDENIEDKHDVAVNYSNADLKKSNIPDGQVAVKATTDVQFAYSNFVTSATIQGIFVIPKAYENAVKKGSEDDLEKVKALTRQIYPVLISKFRTMTALLSNDSNSYNIVPEITYNFEHLKKNTE